MSSVTKHLVLVFLLNQDAEGLKVGVAGLITQWVKGPSDGSRQSLCRPTVSHKHNRIRAEVLLLSVFILCPLVSSKSLSRINESRIWVKVPTQRRKINRLSTSSPSVLWCVQVQLKKFVMWGFPLVEEDDTATSSPWYLEKYCFCGRRRIRNKPLIELFQIRSMEKYLEIN